MAKGDLNVTVGRNRIALADGQVLEHLPGTPSSIDAKLFGAMRAGRIRVVSTAEGAGVRMGSKVMADNGIAIHSAGSLGISGEADTPAKLHSEHGALLLTAADDLALSAVDGKAERIEAKAGKKLTLDAKTRETINHDRDSWNKKFLFITRETYSEESTTTERQQRGVHLQGSDSIALQSGADMRLVAAELKAGGDMSLDSGANLDLAAGIDSKQFKQQVRHRKDLWRGDSDTDQYTETTQPGTLSAQRMTVRAKDTLKVEASNLHSRGDMDLNARQVEVGTTALQHRSNDGNYRGDLVSGTFFGNRKGNDTEGQRVAGSSVTADGTLNVHADQVSIKAAPCTVKRCRALQRKGRAGDRSGPWQ